MKSNHNNTNVLVNIDLCPFVYILPVYLTLNGGQIEIEFYKTRRLERGAGELEPMPAVLVAGMDINSSVSVAEVLSKVPFSPLQNTIFRLEDSFWFSPAL